MQLLLTVGTEWKDLNGMTGVDGQGNNVVISLDVSDNVKIYPHSASARYSWYQGAQIPSNALISAMPIPSGTQSFATYDGTDSFFVRASVEDSKITVIITKGA